MIRVGFVYSFADSWLGGVNYFRNLLTAIYALPERKIEAVIFTGFRSPEKRIEGFPVIKIVRSRLFDKGTWPWRIRHSVLYRFSRDYLFEWLLKIHGISVVSHSGWLPGDSPIPTIGWIPDFQHVLLPDYFLMEELSARNETFSNMCRYCATIIVSSFDAQADLIRFDPSCKSKSEVLQFVVAPPKAEILPSRHELETRYKFSGKFFLLPNQFWKHKNHRLVIEALGLLGLEGKRVLVLATGNTVDYRHPNYFEELIKRAKELDVQENFLHLGIVPSTDLDGLMRDALAIINPSLFEGWSTTVEEAKSLGKQILLSDIPVHREQNPERGRYFLPDDANTLATLLWDVWNEPNSNENEIIENARCATDKRRIEFAKQYQRIILETLEKHKVN